MKTLTILIPVYNDAERVGRTLEAVQFYKPPKGIRITKVRLVNDGSKDNLKVKIRSLKLKKSLRKKLEIVGYRKNMGRGFAVRRGMMGIETDYVMYLDADSSIPISNLAKFVPFMKKNYDLLYGSKKMPGARQTIKRSLLRTIIGYGHSIIASLVLGVLAWDFQGGFKIFSRQFIEEAIPMTNIDRWGFDMEVIFLAKKLGFKTVELPVSWACIKNGSKVKLARDIWRSLKDMFSIRANWLCRYKVKPLFGAAYELLKA